MKTSLTIAGLAGAILLGATAMAGAQSATNDPWAHTTAAAAINLIRLDAWWTGKPQDRTRTTHLQRLDLAA